MGKLILESHAKINLLLDITGKNPDGYHLVRMIMQSVNLKDTITVEITACPDAPAPYRICISSDEPDIPCDSRNTAYKAAENVFNTLNAFKDHIGYDSRKPVNIRIHINKKIPSAAGLAGGSGNAAAVIEALLNPVLWEEVQTLHFDKNIKEKILYNSCISTGADVFYCLKGGTVLAEGYGEILTPIEPPLPYGLPVLLVKPPLDISTKWSYQEYDNIIHNNFTDRKLTEKQNPNLIKALGDALGKGDISRLSDISYNCLELPALKHYPVIGEIKNTLIESGADLTLMTGSGPTVFGIFSNRQEAVLAAGKRHMFPEGSFIALTETTRGGISYI